MKRILQLHVLTVARSSDPQYEYPTQSSQLGRDEDSFGYRLVLTLTTQLDNHQTFELRLNF